MNKVTDNFKIPSKRAVARAGQVLAGTSDLMSADSKKQLFMWRAIHSTPINTLQNYIRTSISKRKIPSAIVAQRLKRAPSIIQKLKRFKDMKFDQMQDIGGVRVIVNKIDDVRKVQQFISNSKHFRHLLELPPNDYIETPKKDGYRSLHQVIRYQSVKHQELNGLRVEIQIRTKLQHSWATAVETLGMIQKSSIKTGGGDEISKRFFLLASALFALDENCNVPEELKNKSKEKLIEEFKEVEKKGNILVQLNGVAVSAHHIDTVEKNFTGYQVIQLFIKEQKVRLAAFKEIDDAESFYKVRELETKDDHNIAVVLMSAGALKDIKKAYPNFFLDTKAFIQNIERILSAS